MLLGFTASGKSTVGEALARRLEWDFLDFDVEIARREQRTVREIVDAEGEENFRELEAELTRAAGGERRVVLAPGGAWVTQPDLLESLPHGTLSVWIRVSPQETVRRVRAGHPDRPFADHPDPLGPITEMLRERTPLLRRADLTVPGDGRTAEEVAFELEQIVRTRGCADPSF